MFTFFFLPAFPKGITGLLLGWLCNGEKEIWVFLEIIQQWLWTNTSQEIKKYLWPTNQDRDYGGQVINGILA